MKMIIYPQEDNSIAVVVPVPECTISIGEIARKDVPAGLPYLIIEADDLPKDMDFFSAWEADFSNPDGYGIGAEAWFAEQNKRF
jgi:hypothetical protein